jgi:hypothetical protein
MRHLSLRDGTEPAVSVWHVAKVSAKSCLVEVPKPIYIRPSFSAKTLTTYLRCSDELASVKLPVFRSFKVCWREDALGWSGEVAEEER